MNAKKNREKMNWIVRFTGGGALLLAIIGLIHNSPLSASEQGARHEYRVHEAGEVGRRYFGAVHASPRRFGSGSENHIAFLEIVLDLSESQVEEIEPILNERREKMDELRSRGRMQGRRAMRMKRMHRSDCCDKVDRTSMRADMRRQRREFEKDRDSMRSRIERHREEMDEKLAKVLDAGQMKKLSELRELKSGRREERRERRGRAL